MRDKYLFEKNTQVASAAAKKRQDALETLFAANKASRKLLSRNAYERMKSGLQTVAQLAQGGAETSEAFGERKQKAIHEVLHEYERDILDIGSWPRFRSAMKLRYPSMTMTEGEGGKVTLTATFEKGEEVIGWIYLDHGRFVRLDPARPDNSVHDVYVRRGDKSGRHYVMLPHTDPPLMVRRYVVRGLNGHNALDLDSFGPIKAAHHTRKIAAMANVQPQEITSSSTSFRHAKTIKDQLSEPEQLLSHTRGWKKRYISAGVGNQPPLSTRGEAFTTIFGLVAIDLGRIEDLGSVFDIHGPRGAKHFMGLEPTKALDRRAYSDDKGAYEPPDTRVPASNLGDEKYLALRDVLRTRELVIKREVPSAAVVRFQGEKRILAVALDKAANIYDDFVRDLRARDDKPIAEEPEAFVWQDGKRWYFALYDSVEKCRQAAEWAKSKAVKNVVKMVSTYSFARPAGMPLGS